MTDIKLPLVATSDHPEFPVMAWSPLELAEINRLMREAVRLNAQAVPDAPTWEQVQKAWYAVGADVAGLDWSAFVRKVSAAPAAPQPAQAVPDGMVLVDRVALNTAISALRRDAKEGRPLRGKWAAALSAAPAAPQPATPDLENILLRQMLAIRVGGALLYTDDGELQDNSAKPCIDFKRDPAHEIHYKLKARAAAPQLAQQPLTEKEIDDVMRKALGYGLSPSRDDLEFARAIEQAHRIGVKND